MGLQLAGAPGAGHAALARRQPRPLRREHGRALAGPARREARRAEALSLGGLPARRRRAASLAQPTRLLAADPAAVRLRRPPPPEPATSAPAHPARRAQPGPRTRDHLDVSADRHGRVARADV